MAAIKWEIELQNKEVGIWRMMGFHFNSKHEATEQIEKFKAMDRIMGYDSLEYRATPIEK